MVVWKAFNVARVIEVPFPLHLHKASIMLADALQAGTPYCCCVRAPIRCSQLAKAIGADANSAIDDRNQMRVGDEVQHMTAPRSVHAGKENITIQSLPEHDIFIDCTDDGLNGAVRRRGARLEIRGQSVYLKLTDILRRGVVQSIEVVLLDTIEINRHYIFSACFDKRIGNEAADAPRSGDSVPQPDEIRLAFFAPGRNSSKLRLRGLRAGRKLVHVMHLQLITDDPDCSAPIPLIGTRCRALPEPSAPGAITGQRQPNEWQAGCAKHRTGIALFSVNVVLAHALPPTTERMTVEQGEPCSRSGGGRQRTFKECRFETRIAMNVTFTGTREEQPFDDGCGPGCAPARVP